MSNNNDNIEDIYPLSPLQEGLLFHTLYAPDLAAYFQQLKFSFNPGLDVEAWQEAWRRVVERHAILRTGFIWHNQPRPLQVVRKKAQLPWRQQDWRGFSPNEQQRRLEELLRADQKRGFDLTKAPVLRLTLIRTGDEDYQFICSQHHLLGDGWSTGIIVKELVAFYNAIVMGQTPDLEKPRPYRDYIAWLQHQDLRKAEAFWRESLQGFTYPTTLAIDSSPLTPIDEAGNQRKLQLAINTETTARLRSFTRQHEVTLNTLLVGAWALLLSRYSGSDDVVFGITVAGRPADLDGVESMVGPLINTLPMRVQLPPDDQFIPWLRQLQLRLLELYEYDYSPLVQIQGWSEVPRGLPLFESAVVFENYPVLTAEQAFGLGHGLREVHAIERSSFPLGLITVPGQELLLIVGYDCRRFDPDAIGDLLEHLHGALENIAADPDRSLSKISLWAQAEWRQVLGRWNETARDYRRDICLHHLFEEQAELRPNNIAVEYEDSHLTYQELNRRANQLAHYLGTLGVGPETLVGVHLERSPELIVALLGIAKAGAAYVPLDPEYPEDRLNFILKDTQVPLIIAPAERRQNQDVRILDLDRDWEFIARHKRTNPARRGAADHPAYVIYTSGSTGQPKGVIISHGAVCNTLLWRREFFALSGDDRILQNISCTFDPSVCQIFGALASGAVLVLARPGGLHDPTYIIDEIIERKITITDFVPAVLQVLLESPGLENCRNLRHVFCGGEVLTGELIKRFYARSDAALHNLYGPTETAIDATCWSTSRSANRRAAPIGRPIANKQIWLLDSRLHPVTVGFTGEVYISGCGLARGYLNNPSLTAERFLPSPYSIEPGARMYSAGDAARYLPEGNLEFVGRNDHQVKVRGLRIELAEIEAVLAAHPGVRRTAVTVYEYPPGNKQLAAYLVSQNGAISLDQMRHFVKQRLPEYMVPSRFALVDSLPLLTNGKVDRRALSSLKPEWVEAEAGYVAPGNHAEESIARIWTELLHADRIGVQDNFFQLGGHSLTAMRLISAIRESFGVEISVRTVFEHPTISSLARIVEAQIKTAGDDHRSLIPRASRDPHPAMSFAQQRLWYLDRLTPNNAFYNIAEIFRLRGVLYPELFENSLNEIVRRHETLRTTFGMEEGRLVQIISAESKLRLKVVDLSLQPEDERENAARLIASEEAQLPFDLEQGPLIRATLLRIDQECHWLLLTIHHIVADGWSLEVFWRELSILYQAFYAGITPNLPELPAQYADYAVWQQNWLRGAVLQKELAYWRRQLDGAPAGVELPTDRARPMIRGNRGATMTFLVTKTIADSLRALSQQESATMFMTLLAALKVLLYRYTSETDLVVGSAIAGRNQRAVENLIGFFVNTLALRTALSADLSFRDVLRRVREVTLESYAHQELPFEKLIEELNPVRDSSRTPLFQIMFGFQSAANLSRDLPGLTIEAIQGERYTAKFDLELSLLDTGRELHWAIEYDVDLFDTGTIERMIGHLQTLLASVLSDSDRRISRLALMPEAELSQLLVEFNDRQANYPLDSGFPRLFEHQVERAPHATAVSFKGRRLSYDELNRLANRIAGSLVAKGMARGGVVAVLSERNIEYLAAMIGVFKAGGVYLPIAPDISADSLAQVLGRHEASFMLVAQGLRDTAAMALGRGSGESRPRLLPIEQMIGLSLDDGNPLIQSSPTDIAYLVSTSGSAEFAGIEHQGMLNHAYAIIAELGMTRADVLAQTASQSSNASIWQFLAALLIGGQVYILPDDVVSDPRRLIEAVGLSGITIVEVYPSFLRAMLDQIDLHDLSPLHLAPLRRLLLTGEALSPSLCRDWLRHYPEIPLMNVYGLTECSGAVSIYPISEPPAVSESRVPIGRPIANLRLYVLDRQMEPAPVGVAGELYVGGIGVGQRHLNGRGDAADAFLPDPCAKLQDSRLYKTGDLARWSPDGNLILLGHIDRQVRIHGIRVDLWEIEAVLNGHPAVRAALVLKPQDEIVAYLALTKGQSCTARELHGYLKERLPNYLAPAHLIFLNAFPLTSQGKIDYRALLALHSEQGGAEDSYFPPRDNFELALVRIWEELLQVTPIGIADNFFDLGGHSLSALRVIAAIRNYFGQSLQLTIFFEGGTIEHLARVLREQFAPTSQSPLVAIQPHGQRPPVFFVHVGSGQVLCYFDLARYLGRDQPFYGLQDPNLSGNGRPFDSVEEMAAHYIDAVQAAQPTGPYLLGGWSFGGLVAFEMAKQLTAKGEQVSLLALLDTGTPDLVREFADSHDDAALLAVLAQEMYLPILASDLRPFDLENQLQYIARKMKEARIMLDDAPSFLKRQLEIFKGRFVAVETYLPTPYQGRITLFMATTLEPEIAAKYAFEKHQAELTQGWAALSTEPVDLHLVPGRHHEIAREPNVQTLARLLKACIDEVSGAVGDDRAETPLIELRGMDND